MPNAFDYLRGEKYIDLVTYRRSGAAIHTPLWFAEQDGRLILMTNPASAKVKRIRNNPNVEVAPCTMRGRRTGPPVPGVATVAEDQALARRLIRKKYLLARLPVWNKNIYLEVGPV